MESRALALAASSLLALSLVASPAKAVVITEYPLAPGSGPQGITVGPDGNVWFVENAANKLGRITSAGTITEVPLAAGAHPSQVVNAGGDLYVTEPGVSKIAFYDVFGGTGVHGVSSDPNVGYALGSMNRIWKTSATGQVAYNDLRFTGSGVGCTVSDGKPHGFYGITASRDGILWMSDVAANEIVAMDPHGCLFGHFALPNSDSGPDFLVQGADGAIWFTETFGNRIGRLQFGSLVEFNLPAGTSPMMIAASPDGTLWFAEQNTNSIGHVTHDGVVTHFPIPTPSSAPYGVVVGADGSVWFTEENGDKIGRLRLHPAGDANDDGSVNVSDVFYLINFLFGGGPPPA